MDSLGHLWYDVLSVTRKRKKVQSKISLKKHRWWHLDVGQLATLVWRGWIGGKASAKLSSALKEIQLEHFLIWWDISKEVNSRLTICWLICDKLHKNMWAFTTYWNREIDFQSSVFRSESCFHLVTMEMAFSTVTFDYNGHWISTKGPFSTLRTNIG